MDMAVRVGMAIQPAVVPLAVRSVGSSPPPQLFIRNVKYYGMRKESRWCADAHTGTYNGPSLSTLKQDLENAAKHVEMMASTRLKQEENILIDLKHDTAEDNIWEDIAKAQETFLALANTEENISLLKGLQSKISFAGVDVVPIFVENCLDIDIPDEDLEINYSISSGKGSQNVNNVQTAIHILHIPTGISVNCAGERSQLANKIKALYRLKEKLLIIAMEQQASNIKQISGDVVNCGCGQQIRNYVFHPEKLVKDV